MRIAHALQHGPCRALNRALTLHVDERATAAVETALILPFAVSLLALLVYGAEGFAIDRKVTQTARTVTDLITQATPTSFTQLASPLCAGMASVVSHTSIDNDLQASSAVLAPYSVSNMTMVVSQVQVNSTGLTANVQWSEAYNGATARPASQVLTLPGSIGTGQAGNCFILGEVYYTYNPLQIFMPLSAITLSGSIYLTPRQSASLSCHDCTTPN
jgi:Flp pilus assembly protein TadG